MRTFSFLPLLGTLAALPLFGCGGGGTGTDPGPDAASEAPATAPDVEAARVAAAATGAAIRGRLEIASAGRRAVVQEIEPNDTAGQVQPLGLLEPGKRLGVYGRITPRAGEADPDGYLVHADTRMRLRARLTHATTGSTDFDLLAFDPVALRYVDSSRTAESPEELTLTFRGDLHLVVRARRGAGAYTLVVEGLPFTSVEDEEPNDALSRGTYVGALALGDLVTAPDMSLRPGDDDQDSFKLSVPNDIALFVQCHANRERPGGLVVRVLDITQGARNARPLAEFGPHFAPTGTVAVPAGTLVAVEVKALAAVEGYRILFRADAPANPASVARLPARAPASAAQEGSALDLEAGVRAYGVVGGDGEVAAGEVIVTPAPGASFAALRTRLETQGFRFVSRMPDGPALFRRDLAGGLSTADAARSTLSLAATASAATGVRGAEPNALCRASVVPNDPRYAEQWALSMIHADRAWDSSKGSASQVLAIVDTGMTNHPDLAGRWVPGYDFVSDAGSAGDGDGIDPDPTDLSFQTWHGTVVASIAGGASQNGAGVAGVTWNTKLMPVRVLGRAGTGSYYDVMQGCAYAAGLPNASGRTPAVPARVVNMSLGGGYRSQAFQDLILSMRARGVLVVAAAGNEGDDTPSYPAGFDGVLAVGAVQRDRTLPIYSNFGSWVDLVAPGGGEGGGVLSAGWPNGTGAAPGYVAFSGTSMAAPHVAGVAALALALKPGLTPADLESLLTRTTADLGAPGFDTTFAHGLLDAHAVVRDVAGLRGPRLDFDPGLVDLSWSDSSAVVKVRNGGTSRLRIAALEVVEGASWLSAQAFGGGDATRDRDEIRVVARRAGLAPGAYLGRIRVRCNDPEVRELSVLLEVLDGTPEAPLAAEILVVVKDPAGRTVAKKLSRGPADRAFSFDGLPAGDFRLFAGTDLDKDGLYGEELAAAPLAIQVTRNQVRTDVALKVGLPPRRGTATFRP